MSPYILKTRAITGDLVPLNGEHREYADAGQAFRDAVVFAQAGDSDVFVVDFPVGRVVGQFWGFRAQPEPAPEWDR